MRSKISFSICLIFSFVLLVQLSAEPVMGEEEYLAFAEVMPEPVGGMGAIIKNVKYPETAQKTNTQGRVYVLAYIDENGNCTDVKVVRGIGAGCDEAAAAAVMAAKFTPGKNKGKNVKVKLSLPIEFKLS
ncbi:MAG: TonB family protein [Melioribacteraceae bacterium]|nr:TonB family protein [Melioribacteraceae bacterium]